MAKLLLVLFAARPFLDCLIISLMCASSMKLPDALSYFAMVAIILHYGYMGLKEVFQK